MSKRSFEHVEPGESSFGDRRYHHTPCSGTQVRLFQIVSAGWNVKLKLETFDLGRCPKYVGFSYTWDPRPRTTRVKGYGWDTKDMTHTFKGIPYQNKTNPNQPQPDFPKVTIEVNGLPYQISYHLLRGLRTMHKYCFGPSLPEAGRAAPGTFRRPLWVFVDAICISQNDPDDKAAQVANMHIIFHKATHVFMWLGKGMYGVANDEYDSSGKDAGVGICLNEVPRLVGELKGCIQYLKQLQNGQAGDEDADAIVRLQGHRPSIWGCLHAIEHIPWFDRLWVVQEAALAHEVIMLCGIYSLPWSVYIEFSRLAVELLDMPNVSAVLPDEVQEQLSEAIIPRALGIDTIRKLVPQYNDRAANRNTFDSVEHLTFGLIDLIRRSFVLEPLDRIYAVLALLGNDVRRRIHIDYSEKAKLCYWRKWVEGAQAMISASPYLAECLLSHASYLQRRQGMPSWCPTLDDNSHGPGSIVTYPGSKAGMYKGLTPPDVADEKHVDQGPRISPIKMTDQLCASVVRFDKIGRTVDFTWTDDAFPRKEGLLGFSGDMPPELATMMLDSLSACSDLLDDSQPGSPNGEARLARCLVAGGYGGEPVPSEQLLTDFRLYKEWLQYHSVEEHARSQRNYSFETETPAFGTNFQMFAFKGCFFVTTSGRPGITSYRAKEGDVAVVIIGLGMPYVLRQLGQTGNFEFIGEAYIDGVMDGECLKKTTDEAIRIEEIKIC